MITSNPSPIYHFAAYQVAPAGELYEQEFMSVVSSIEALSEHPLAKGIVEIAKKNNFPLHPVVGFKEFPGAGVGGAVEVGPGVYRACIIGTQAFLNECGLNVPELLIVAMRRWESEGAMVVLGGWDGWARGVLKFVRQQNNDN